ncbi:MAG TPA: hypothetical protein PLR74_14155, partial [Agriterribacter sp.]|nr:hypothetical protein [Agriterribacter sp.]
MKKIVWLVLLIVSINVAAQEPIAIGCDPAALKTQPGKWLPQPKDAVTGEPYRPAAADIAGAKKIMNRVQQLFQEQYQPIGMDAYHYHHFM